MYGRLEDGRGHRRGWTGRGHSWPGLTGRSGYGSRGGGARLGSARALLDVLVHLLQVLLVSAHSAVVDYHSIMVRLEVANQLGPIREESGVGERGGSTGLTREGGGERDRDSLGDSRRHGERRGWEGVHLTKALLELWPNYIALVGSDLGFSH